MKRNTLITALATVVATSTTLVSTAVHAHEGHGMPGFSHWHGTDVLGFAAIAGVVIGLVWLKGRK